MPYELALFVEELNAYGRTSIPHVSQADMREILYELRNHGIDQTSCRVTYLARSKRIVIRKREGMSIR